MTLRKGHGRGAGQLSLLDWAPAGRHAGLSRPGNQASSKSRKGCTHAPVEVRFWRYVAKGPGCWLWQAACADFGYGLIGSSGHMLRAHRLSWEIHHGPIPEGMFVCHRCDVPACVRPDHLFLGTHTDNMRDMIRKGRHRGAVAIETYLGERNGRSKLTADKVRELRALRDSGESLRSLARRFGVSKPSVQAIVSRKNWRHVA